MDYKKLHRTSTVDLLADTYKNYRPRRGCVKSRTYEVERLIAKRNPVECTEEYLVKWQGYSKYEATWEIADDISPECIRLFEHPEPEQVDLLAAVDIFRSAVESPLKSKSCLPLTIDFPSHVYRYLFGGKGEVSGGWLYLEKQDFCPKLFPKDWDKCLNQFGEGHCIYFPLRLRHFLSWSPKKFVKGVNGDLHQCTRAYSERLSFSFARSPC